MNPDPTQLSTQEIREEVREVLLRTARGKGAASYLTAFQILNRLSEPLRRRLIAERGLGGRGSGSQFSAAALVAKAAEHLEGVEVAYLDVNGVQFSVEDRSIEHGYEVCGLYRLVR